MKIHIKTYGCSLNHADSESIAGVLKKAGHELSELKEADVIVINTCTVKDPSQDKFLTYLRKQKKPVVVAGCIPQADKQNILKDYPQLGVDNIHRADEIVKSAAKGIKLQLLSKTNIPRLAIPKIRTNPYVEIIPICAGCLSNCTYCKTKQARGNLKSYPLNDIINTCKKAIDQGVKEIWLTSQDNGAYGMDINTNCAELLNKVSNIEGDFMIRFGMTNPDWTIKHLYELIEAYKKPKIYKFLHLPIQSGSNKVLNDMRRRCTVEDIKTIVNEFRKAIPDITIATDIICGYPTETEEDFEQTLQLVKELRFQAINISKFYARPDTYAAKLKRIDSKIVKERSRRLTKLFESEQYQIQYQHLKKTMVKALFTKYEKNSYVGRDINYRQVIVKTKQNILGTWQDVLITETTRDDLRGKIISHKN